MQQAPDVDSEPPRPRALWRGVASGLGEIAAVLCAGLTGDRRVRALLLILAAAPALPYLSLGGREPYLADDAYYYLLPACNFWKYGFYTFDGISHTNGFHPLWMGLLTVLALPLVLTGQTGQLPLLTELFSVLLTVYTLQVLYGMLRTLGVAKPVALPALALFAGATTELQLNGLETGLVLATMATLCLYVADRLTRGSPGKPVALAVLSLLVLFARLDGAVLLLILYALLVKPFGPRRVIVAGILLTLLASPYFALNLYHHGHLSPISGRVKQHWGDRYELETAGKTFGLGMAQFRYGPGRPRLRRIYTEYLPRDLALAIRPALPARWNTVTVQYTVPFLLLLGGAAVLLRRKRGHATYAGIMLAIALLAHYVCILAYYTFGADQVWPWYGASGVAWFSLVPALCLMALLGPRIRRYAAPLFTAGLLAANIWQGVAAANRQQAAYPHNLDGTYQALADWLRGNMAAGDAAGGWAVGKIGWESRRRVVNLEGLIADEALLEWNRRSDLLPYIHEHELKYITNFWRPSYAPLPEAVLAPELADTHWINGKNRVRYFWSLRLRPFIDCPEAFQIAYRCEAGDWRETSGYVLSVDQPILAAYLARRTAWRDALRESATVLPAEEASRVDRGIVEANARRAEGYTVRAKVTGFTLRTVPGGPFRIFARVCNLRDSVETLTFTAGDVEHKSALPATAKWTILPLSPVLDSDSTSECAIASPRSALCLDEIYLVPEEKVAAFARIEADW